MGLDCIIKYHNKKEFTSELPIEILEELKTIMPYYIVGFDITEYDKYHFVSFRGKAYVFIISKLTNISLYKDLESEELKKIYEKLNNFIENQDCMQIDDIQKAYDNTLNAWSAMPLVSNNVSASFETSSGTIWIVLTPADGTGSLNNPGAFSFKAVTIPPAMQKLHPNLNYKNYSEVARTFGIN